MERPTVLCSLDYPRPGVCTCRGSWNGRQEAKMPDDAQFLVKVDLDKLHFNLSRTWRQRLTLEDTHDFLHRSGFRQVPGGWLTFNEDRLMRLDPSEVISVDKLGSDD